MIVVDSSVWIAHFRDEATRETQILAVAAQRRGVLICDLILVEVLQGFPSAARFKQALAAFDEMPQATIGGRDMAVAAARNYRKLRATGVTPRGTIDVLIATFCIENNHILLHADRDFDAMEKHLGLVTL